MQLSSHLLLIPFIITSHHHQYSSKSSSLRHHHHHHHCIISGPNTPPGHKVMHRIPEMRIGKYNYISSRCSDCVMADLHEPSAHCVLRVQYLSIRESIYHMFIYRYAYPSVYLSIHPFYHLCIHPSMYLSIYVSIIYVSIIYVSIIYVSIHLCIHSPIHSFNHLSIHSSIHSTIYPSIHSCTHVSMHPSIYLSIHLSIHISIYPSIYLLADGQPDLPFALSWANEPWYVLLALLSACAVGVTTIDMV